MLLTVLSASAYDFYADGLYYNILSEEDRTIEVASSDDYSYEGAIDIPAKVSYKSKTYTVTSIGNSAFYDCKSLTSVAIPNSVNSIGTSAFMYCN